MADQEDSLVITRILAAPREEVWKAWSDPEILMKWWGPKDFSCPVAKIDFREGGKYLVAMHGPAGTEYDKDMWSTGVYQEVVPMEKIAVVDSFADEQGNVVTASHYGMPESMPKETKVILSFEEENGKTKMTLYYPNTTGIEGKTFDNMKQGWYQSFDKLTRLVETKS
jgi:uncharacterized protein YndB with AHSA1/START domain